MTDLVFFPRIPSSPTAANPWHSAVLSMPSLLFSTFSVSNIRSHRYATCGNVVHVYNCPTCVSTLQTHMQLQLYQCKTLCYLPPNNTTTKFFLERKLQAFSFGLWSLITRFILHKTHKYQNLISARYWLFLQGLFLLLVQGLWRLQPQTQLETLT